jgi:endonuclease-3 related protein
MPSSDHLLPDAKLLMEIFHRLSRHFGHQHWWPGDTQLEMMVGAILTQNTAWSNVEKAINRLMEAKGLTLQALLHMPEETLERLIRPCGYYRVKAQRLKNLLLAVHEKSDGKLTAFLSLPTADLRETLLAVSGVGPETADSILLYAAQRPVFVVDTYTRRALFRHGWVPLKATYDEVQSLFMQCLPPDAALYNEYHALWVALGKIYCRPQSRCAGCPLEVLLDKTGLR